MFELEANPVEVQPLQQKDKIKCALSQLVVVETVMLLQGWAKRFSGVCQGCVTQHKLNNNH